MKTSFIIFSVLAAFGLGCFIGSLLCEIEEWTLGSTIAFSRIIGGSLFIVAGVLAFIFR